MTTRHEAHERAMRLWSNVNTGLIMTACVAIIVSWGMPTFANPGTRPAPRSLWQLGQDLKAAGHPIVYQEVKPPSPEAFSVQENDDWVLKSQRKAIGQWWVIGPGLHFEARQYKDGQDAAIFTGQNYAVIGNWRLEGIDYSQLNIIRKVYNIDANEFVDPFGRYYFLDLPFKVGYAKFLKLVKEAGIGLALGEARKYVFKDGTLTFSFPNASGSDYFFEKRNMGMGEALEIGKLLAGSYAKDIDFSHPNKTASSTDPSGSISFKMPPDPESDADAEVIIKTFGEKAEQVEFHQQSP